jgi:hypothetical protein
MTEGNLRVVAPEGWSDGSSVNNGDNTNGDGGVEEVDNDDGTNEAVINYTFSKSEENDYEWKFSILQIPPNF